MIDHLLTFVDEATAKAALPKFWNGNNWDTSRCIPGASKITQEAKYDANNVLLSAEQKAAGWWIIVALPDVDSELTKIGSCVTAERGLGMKMLDGARIAPIFCGSDYTFDDVSVK